MTVKDPVPWSLRDCLWASLPALIVFSWGGLRRLRGYPTFSEMGWGPAMMTVLLLATAAVWMVPVYLVAIRKRGGSATDLGYVRAPFWNSAGLVFTALFLNGASNAAWLQVVRHFGLTMQPDMLKRFGPGWQGLALALVLAAVIAPIAEETFFRGFLFQGLRKHYRFWIAAWTSSFIFGVGHMVPGAILPITVLGFLLAWLRERTGSIWPSIAMHVVNNALYFLARFILANQTAS